MFRSGLANRFRGAGARGLAAWVDRCSLAGLCLWLLAAVCLAWVSPAAAQPLQPVPPLSARVTDLTGTLDAGQKQRLEAQLAALEARKGAQVVVLLVPTTRPEAIEQYSIRVAEAWKIGRGTVDGKRVDDGVILLVAKDDRKVRLEVGYGLEGAIPDALAKRIIAEAITPRFRQGDFFGGLQLAVEDITKLIDREALPAPWQPGQGGRPADLDADQMGWVGTALVVLVGGLIATAVLGRLLGSMVGGAGAGVVASTMGLPLLAAGIIGFVVFLFLLVFAAAGIGAGRRVGRSGPVIMLPPGGFGGGRGGRGGFGGGGFGGGGGGFGGGGASGGW